MSAGATFRAFYAVPFEAAVARSLEATGREATAGERDWRVTPAERMHITLRFLGETATDLVPRLADALRAAAAGVAPFRVTIGGLVRFPGVLSLSVSDPTGSLPRLAEALGSAAEPRPFRPHVTVARTKKAGRSVPPPASGRGTEALVDRIVL